MPTYRSKQFIKCDWSEFYPDAAEAIPNNMPQLRGKEHQSCGSQRGRTQSKSRLMGRSYLQCGSRSKWSRDWDTSCTWWAFLAIPDECAVFCDNSAVVKNSRPESTLKKKHAAINFHRVREAIAAGTIKVAKEDTRSNLADILIKLMPGHKMKVFLEHFLW